MREGVIAEFESADALRRARTMLAAEGYAGFRAWSPYAVDDAVRTGPQSIVPWIMLFAALMGGTIGYLVQWWTNGFRYPIDVGGRPLNPLPAFVPIVFESAVLAACVTGFIAMLASCGLPRLVHPLFEVDGFERASVDRFWLWIDANEDATPPLFERLTRLGALRCLAQRWSA